MSDSNPVKIVQKPWGREIWLAHTDRYAFKIIEFKAGVRHSLHYHLKKHEHVYVELGVLQLDLEDETGEMHTLVLHPGEVVEMKPGRKHRAAAIEDVRLMEVSTPELDDIVRLQDDYNR
jgi:mannose-6-phosphate isomerase